MPFLRASARNETQFEPRLSILFLRTITVTLSTLDPVWPKVYNSCIGSLHFIYSFSEGRTSDRDFIASDLFLFDSS